MLPSERRRMRYPSVGELGDLEAPDPRPLVAVADVDLRPGRQRGPSVRIRRRPPCRRSRPHRIDGPTGPPMNSVTVRDPISRRSDVCFARGSRVGGRTRRGRPWRLGRAADGRRRRRPAAASSCAPCRRGCGIRRCSAKPGARRSSGRSGDWCEAWSVGHATSGRMRRVGHDGGAAGGRPAGPGRPRNVHPTPSWSTGHVDLLRRIGQLRGRALPGRCGPIVDGDARCASVAAASVLAKVVRDRLMREEAEHFPAYGFERNKGYPSPVHQTALARLRALGHPSAQLVLRGVVALERRVRGR